ncbi:hypothetical protein R3W88_014752 [Solanum pinnatisectum]|uniref:Uncharacterized protein n=1 Tax=Solanum pinnatisectum TaxID=50273 RepID=A0AAV9KSV7_9SOLN|nr:hypothetical protein R3W88_014752 [Solanum pinnatisectum]
MEALITDGLLQHPDIDVKASVASCISEIMRITAPDQPYDDSRLTNFFELAMLAFGKLSFLDGHCYSKVVSIIEVLAKYRTCVLMWDLELDALIIQMFQHFLNSIRLDHLDQVFMDIEEITSIIIKESEEIPMQLLNILISSVKKENQNVLPRSYVLGERVLQESVVKLHPYLPKVVRSLGISINNDLEVVELIWIEALEKLAPHVAPDIVVPFLDQAPILLGKDDPKHTDNDVILETDTILKESEHGDAMKQQKSTDSKTISQSENLGFVNAVAKKAIDPEATQTSKKRGCNPNFLKKPKEGYDHAWVSGERRSKSRILLKGCGKYTKKRSICSPKCAISKGLYGEEKTPIITSRDAPGAITKKKVSQPTLVASEEFDVALGFVFSITKESNFAKTSKDQRKRKNSPSQEKALGSVSNTKERTSPKTSKEQHKRKNLPSQEGGLGSVVREHGKELVGCRVRVWWPLDQHMVIYGDGDQEMLNLTKEHPIHEIAPCPSDLSDMRLRCIIDSYRHTRKKKKALNADNDEPLLTPGTENKKNACSKTKLYSGKATDDLMTPTMTMQHNSTPKGVHQNKGIEVEGSESGVDENPRSLTITIKVLLEDGDVSSELVDVRGYKVKVSSAPILATILAKYGGITINCQCKSLAARAFH